MKNLRKQLGIIAVVGAAAASVAACSTMPSLTPPSQTAQVDRPYPPGYYGTPYSDTHSTGYYRPTTYYNRPTDYGWDRSNTYHREHD